MVANNSKIKRMPSTPKPSRLFTWVKLIAVTGFAQVLVQVIGFISGILVIRLLPTHEYALYTLANTMLGTMTLLADGGISTGVMSQGGKVWQDKQKLGAVLVTGMQLRNKFAVFSLLVATPILFYLLRKHDASWLMSSMIVLSLIPAFFTSLSGTLLEIVPKLHQEIKPLQKVQVISNIWRLALLGLTLFVYPFAAVAIASAGGSQIWSNWRLRKITNCFADLTQQEDPVVRKEILGVVKRIMPGAVYYSLSGQVTVWLISVFGTTLAVAQIGALGRLAMILNIVNILFSTLIVPRFARLPDIRKTLISRFLIITIFTLTLSLIIISLIWQYPVQTLWILGKDYSGLKIEVTLMAAGSCVSLIAGIIYSMSVSRAKIIPPLFLIPFAILVQILLFYLLNPRTVIDILVFSLLLNGVHSFNLFLLFSRYPVL